MNWLERARREIRKARRTAYCQYCRKKSNGSNGSVPSCTLLEIEGMSSIAEVPQPRNCQKLRPHWKTLKNAQQSWNLTAA